MDKKLPIILDGATGTALVASGMPKGVSPELWTLENPNIIKKIQSEYTEAGSQIVYTPTFGANPVKLNADVYDTNKRLARLSSCVCDCVAGDIAPCGVFIAPFGDYDMASLVEIYEEQVVGLFEDVSLFVIETSMTIAEARSAYLAIRLHSDKPVFVTFTLEENGRTVSGADPRAALVIFSALGAAAFGLNCSFGPEGMLENIKRLDDLRFIPFIAKPNAGLPQNGEYTLGAREFASLTHEFYDAGVRIFGGCCGTMAEHISALADEVKKLPESEFFSIEHDFLANERVVVSAREAVLSDEITDMYDAAELEDECPLVRIKTLADAVELEENQHFAKMPVVIACDDESALSRALLGYNGRAGVISNIPSDILLPILKTYGAFCMN